MKISNINSTLIKPVYGRSKKNDHLSKYRYEGQALAIVLVVLVVAVIIAMAIISRVFNDRVRVADERASAESIEIADSALDSFRNIALEDIRTVAEDPDVTLCSDDPSYNFLESGCVLDNFSEFQSFMNELETQVPGFDSDPYTTTINSDLVNQCAGDDNGIKIIFEKFSPEDSIEIERDGVFAVVTNGQTPNPAACTIELDATPQGGGQSGILVTGVYVTVDANGDITSYKNYEYSDTIGYCLMDASCSTSWPNWSNWIPSPSGSITGIPTQKSSNNLYELRVRAIGTPIALSTSFSPDGCMEIEDLLKISAIVNCGGNSRGKEFVLTGEDWAPSVFDYVLFNGDGQLQAE